MSDNSSITRTQDPVTGSLSAAGSSAAFYPIPHCKFAVSYSFSTNFAGCVALQRSYDGGQTWYAFDMQEYKSDGDITKLWAGISLGTGTDDGTTKYDSVGHPLSSRNSDVLNAAIYQQFGGRSDDYEECADNVCYRLTLGPSRVYAGPSGTLTYRISQ